MKPDWPLLTVAPVLNVARSLSVVLSCQAVETFPACLTEGAITFWQLQWKKRKIAAGTALRAGMLNRAITLSLKPDITYSLIQAEKGYSQDFVKRILA